MDQLELEVQRLRHLYPSVTPEELERYRAHYRTVQARPITNRE